LQAAIESYYERLHSGGQVGARLLHLTSNALDIRPHRLRPGHQRPDSLHHRA
jgi:hypothetical protein